MKKIRIGLMAFAALTGIGGAFAFNHPFKHRVGGVTYYAQKNGTNSFQWVTTAPDPLSLTCQSGGDAACTITSTYDVTGSSFNNQLPARATIVNPSHADEYYQ